MPNQVPLNSPSEENGNQYYPTLSNICQPQILKAAIDATMCAAGYVTRLGRLNNGQQVSMLIVPALGSNRDTDGDNE